MGWIGSVVSAVTKVANVATGGVIGKHIADALSAMGLPPTICNIVAMIGDPSYSTKALCEEIDRAGKALGLPPALTGALKKLVEKAEQYAQAFAQGGFGALVMAVGKDIGLPDDLCHLLAAAIDAYTGNAPGAAAHLMALAAKCAKALGVPDSAMDIALFAADAYTGNVKGAASHALNIAADVFVAAGGPAELASIAAIAGGSLTGDKEAVKAGGMQLAGQVLGRMGAPPEVMGLVNLAIAYQSGDKEKMKEAATQVAGQLINRLDLPPLLKQGLTMGLNAAINDPEKAKEFLKDLPAQIAKLPEKARAAAQAAYDTILNLSAEKTGEKKDVDWGKLAGNLLEKGKSYLPPEAEKAYDIGLAVAKGDKEALKALLAEAKTAATEIGKGVVSEFLKKLDPESQKAIQMVIDGDKAGLQRLLNGSGASSEQEIRDELAKLGVPLRA